MNLKLTAMDRALIDLAEKMLGILPYLLGLMVVLGISLWVIDNFFYSEESRRRDAEFNRRLEEERRRERLGR